MRAAITRVQGPTAVLQREDIDTDAIFPGRYLKTTVREGMGAYLFADWMAAGHPESAFVSAGKGTKILLARRNFGCGSSREHAVWALEDYGIEAIIALSFGDIFRNNCVKNGIITATVTEPDHQALSASLHGDATMLELALASGKITTPSGKTVPFELAPGHLAQLLSGEDDITRSLRYAEAISAHEMKVARETPWLQRLG
jgi:3-isopropylmalate/(R)-2-methylmalate dehydratase small subunit